MKKLVVILMFCGLVVVTGCSTSKYEKGMQDVHRPMPTNRATAEGDIRMLEHEKAHVQEQILQGASSITPAGAVIGIVTGTERTRMTVGTGEYNRMIDKRIREIKDRYGIE